MITFAELVAGKKSRAAASPSLDGPRRADRAAKSSSARQDAKALSAVAGEVRRTRPGNASRYAHLAAAGDTSRFAAFAAASDESAAEIAAQVERRQTLADIPAGHGMRAAAIRGAIGANGGRLPGAKSPDDVAAFVMASAAKARGQPAPATAAARPVSRQPNLSTPESAAAFVQASAAKARGKPDMSTPEGVAAHALAVARRAGVIR